MNVYFLLFVLNMFYTLWINHQFLSRVFFLKLDSYLPQLELMGSNDVCFVHWCVYNAQSSGPHQNCLGISKEGSHLNRHEVNRLQPRAEPLSLIHTNTNMYIITSTYTVIRTYLLHVHSHMPMPHLYTCSHVHTHMCTYKCIHIQICTPTYTFTHTGTPAAFAHPYIHTYSDVYPHICTLMHTHLYTLIYYTHSHMLAHTHTQRKS